MAFLPGLYGNGYPNGYPFFNGIAHDAADHGTNHGKLETVVFSAIRADIDESRSDYMGNVENGKKDVNGKPLVRCGYHWLGGGYIP